MPGTRAPLRRLGLYLRRGVGSSLVAVGVTAGVIAVVNLAGGRQGNGSPTVAAEFPNASPSTPAGAGAPSATAGAGETGAGTTPALPARTPTPTPTTTVPPARGKIVVYDAAADPALTAGAVKALTTAGYDVRQTSAIRANLATSTVFYDPPDAAAARMMVALKLGVNAAAPRAHWLQPTGTLIVIITSSFPRA